MSDVFRLEPTAFDVSRTGVLVYGASSSLPSAPRRPMTWVDRKGREEAVSAPPRAYMYPRISPDGTRVAIDSRDEGQDIWTWDLTRRILSRATTDPAQDTYPVWSPDGRWLAYQSNESGQDEVYVRPFPSTNSGRWTISSGGGTRPVWARNGRELFYVAGAIPSPIRMMRVGIESGATFSARPPQLLFEGRYYVDPSITARGRTYDVSTDAQRFLMIKDAEHDEPRATPQPLVVVLNWADAVKRG